jgi:hypothetical protein
LTIIEKILRHGNLVFLSITLPDNGRIRRSFVGDVSEAF